MPGNEYGGNNSTSPKCGKWSIFANQVTYTIYVLIFAHINFSELLEMHSGKIFTDFIFAVLEGQICNFSI